MPVSKPKFELETLAAGYDYVIGIDEVGRGAIAGPVVACACLLKREFLDQDAAVHEFKWKNFVRDSKTLSEKQREEIAPKIIEQSIALGIGQVSSDDIDAIKIHEATLLAMRYAVEQLVLTLSVEKTGEVSSSKPVRVALLIDGIFQIKDLALPGYEVAQQTIIAGDSKILSIAAASIIAKTHRDQLLRELDKEMPEYGFSKHKGYGTKSHFEAIIKHGQSPVHRKSFLEA